MTPYAWSLFLNSFLYSFTNVLFFIQIKSLPTLLRVLTHNYSNNGSPMISWYASLLACVKAPSMVIPKPPPIWIWGQRQGRTGGGLLKIWDMGKSSILAISPYSCTKVCLSKIWYTKDEIVIYQSKFWEKKDLKNFNFWLKTAILANFMNFTLWAKTGSAPTLFGLFWAK